MREDGSLEKPFKAVAVFRVGDPYIIQATAPYRAGDGPSIKTEIIEWTRKNTTGRWRTQEQSRRIQYKPSGGVRKLMIAQGVNLGVTMEMIEYWIEFVFAEERDAILFKTFWL
jgi:hypothetical protein